MWDTSQLPSGYKITVSLRKNPLQKLIFNYTIYHPPGATGNNLHDLFILDFWKSSDPAPWKGIVHFPAFRAQILYFPHWNDCCVKINCM